MDSDELNNKLQEDIQKVTNYLQEIANYRYHLLLYKLIKGGHIKIGILAELSGYSTKHIYNVVAALDSKEEEPTQ